MRVISTLLTRLTVKIINDINSVGGLGAKRARGMTLATKSSSAPFSFPCQLPSPNNHMCLAVIIPGLLVIMADF